MLNIPRVVIIGAGIGGLTTAALLLKSGLQVTVFEAQTYPGGSAGTFFHKGYRFDAGATLAGGFFGNGPHQTISQILNINFPVKPVDPAWIVHLPGKKIVQWTDRYKWEQERKEKLPGSENFWKRQEKLAELSWNLTQQYFPYPPQNLKELSALSRFAKPKYIKILPNLLKSVQMLAGKQPDPTLISFLDAQLMISAQTTSQYANAIYGSAALDLPRRGVVSIDGGIGAIAGKLAGWIQNNGGSIHYRQQVTGVQKKGKQWVVETQKGIYETADLVVANLTPEALTKLFDEGNREPAGSKKPDASKLWGAFTLYLGLEKAYLDKMDSSHHQVIVNPDLAPGEGNTVFISLNNENDHSRAPQGHITATISTHTRVPDWWHLFENDPQAYQAKRSAYTEKVLDAAEIAVPGIRKAIRLKLSGTPVTFQFYTGRPHGLVGGRPQTSLFNVKSPASGHKNVWLVGDSIFPGQSTAAVTLNAMRVAQGILDSLPTGRI